VLRRTYLGMVSKVDSVVGRIVADLQRFNYLQDGEERSIFNDTIIIFSSDNGGMSEVIFVMKFSFFKLLIMILIRYQFYINENKIGNIA
jgi:arylsulfatase A-like enzyme